MCGDPCSSRAKGVRWPARQRTRGAAELLPRTGGVPAKIAQRFLEVVGQTVCGWRRRSQVLIRAPRSRVWDCGHALASRAMDRPVAFTVRRTSRPGDRVETVFTVLAEESPGSIGQGGCQRQPGVTRGTVPQRTDRRFFREPVRVKRWCKRPPASRVTGTARQTPPGARSRRARAGDRTNPRRRSRVARPMPAGGPLEPAGDGRPRWMVATRCDEHREQDPAYRSTRPPPLVG